MKKDFASKIRQYGICRESIYREIIKEHKSKPKKYNGPKLRFKNYYKNYIETKLNGEEPTALQTVEIVKQFLNDEENSKLKEIYTIEDIMRWLPTRERDDDGR